MFTSPPWLCHLHVYLVVPDATGNQSAAGSRFSGAGRRGPVLAFTHGSALAPRAAPQSPQELSSFPHLLALGFSPSSLLQPGEGRTLKVTPPAPAESRDSEQGVCVCRDWLPGAAPRGWDPALSPLLPRTFARPAQQRPRGRRGPSCPGGGDGGEGLRAV